MPDNHSFRRAEAGLRGHAVLVGSHSRHPLEFRVVSFVYLVMLRQKLTDMTLGIPSKTNGKSSVHCFTLAD